MHVSEPRPGEPRRMTRLIDPTFDPLQDLQKLKEQVRLLELAVRASDRLHDEIVNTIKNQQAMINSYRKQNIELMALIRQQQELLENK